MLEGILCVGVDVREAVIWSIGAGVKEDRMRIIYTCAYDSLLIIFQCVSYCYFTAHICNQYYSV